MKARSAQDRASMPTDVTPPTKEPQLHNASIAKGLRVLEAFNNKDCAALTLMQLVAITGLEKSAVQRFTATLVELGYLRKDPVRRSYSVAPKLLHLGTSYVRNYPLIERAAPYLLEWHRDHDETINLVELDGSQVIFDLRIRSRKIVTTDFSVGSYAPWHASAGGQVIAAWLSEQERAELMSNTELTRYTANTLTDRKAVDKRLAQVRKRGYSLCVGEWYDHDISLGAPVLGPGGRVVAAVVTAVVSPKWKPREAEEKLAASLCLLAKAIGGLQIQ
jgi:DNA-binding IclR family transcriptional regulator